MDEDEFGEKNIRNIRQECLDFETHSLKSTNCISRTTFHWTYNLISLEYNTGSDTNIELPEAEDCV